MSKARKTRAQKIQSVYRLNDFRLKVSEATARRDVREFDYLSANYVVGDLRKTLIYTAVVLTLLYMAKYYLR